MVFVEEFRETRLSKEGGTGARGETTQPKTPVLTSSETTLESGWL